MDNLPDNSIFTKLKNNTDMKDTVTVHCFLGGGDEDFVLVAVKHQTVTKSFSVQESSKWGRQERKPYP